MRGAICGAALAGLALAVVVPAAGGPATTAAARAAVSHGGPAQLAVGAEQGSRQLAGQPLAGTTQLAITPGAMRPHSGQRGVAPISDRFPASGLAADGMPVTALMAYRKAAARAASGAPSCGITWPLLAGIGRVESDHGRFAGAVLHSDGLSTPPVIGIPLDGRGTALIRDTDGGALDGDTVYDRAVGPMQFIPSTWVGWGVDANGDGVRDPFNIFDAAAAAADYLCAAGHNLTTTRGQVEAILSYNWSWSYVRMVMSLEKVYASGAVGITVPVLPTTPDRRRLTAHEPTLPPVNPGPPVATRSVHDSPRASAPAPEPTTSTPAPTHTTTSPAPSSSVSTPKPSGGGSGSTSSSPSGSSSGGSTSPSEPSCPTGSSSPAPGQTSSAPAGCPSSSDPSPSTSASPTPQPSSTTSSGDPTQSGA